jgi:hypothetical protein
MDGESVEPAESVESTESVEPVPVVNAEENAPLAETDS